MTTEVAGRRVALLARPGAACDRLREVLDAAGAQRVLEADPTGLEPPALSAAGAEVIVVALDSVTEEALDRFDEVLGNPAIDVIFEEADLAAAREGWDAARWQRHLIAKLRGHRDVLPPGPIAAAAVPGLSAAEAGPAGDQDRAAPVSAPAGALASHGEAASAPAPAPERHPFDPVDAEFSGFDGDGVTPRDDFQLAGVTGHELDFATDDEPAAAAGSADGFAPAAGEDAVVAADGLAPAQERDSASNDPAVGLGGFGELTLDDGSGPAATDNDETASRFRHDLVDLEQRISSLELVDDTPVRGPERARGAVLVLAGLGGPDAVRQLLGALPADFPRPVLVQQRLDGGRYDKLVAQMQRATELPVALAEAGQPAAGGTVYILPAEVGVDGDDEGLRFHDRGGDVLPALPAADSAVLLLSGSDPASVDLIMNQQWSGAVVAGQAADGCYDPAAANALAARGGDIAQPAELARRLAERWPADRT